MPVSENEYPPVSFTDQDLESRVLALRMLIESWLNRKELGDRAGVKSWLEHYDDEPESEPCILIVWHEGDLYEDPNLTEELCLDVIGEAGYFAESLSSSVIGVYIDDDQPLKDAFRDYLDWKWLSLLIEESYFDLNAEMFEYVAKNPSRLHNLSSRSFETFLDAVFRNNGYRTVLGPGIGDGGVDIRLYGNDVVGEVLTLVQAKRYRSDLAIGLEAVQALSGAVEAERANRGLFVTTSRYLPGARQFADRIGQRLVLAEPSHIMEWSERAKLNVQRDKSSWVSPEAIRERLVTARANATAPGVFVAEVGSI